MVAGVVNIVVVDKVATAAGGRGIVDIAVDQVVGPLADVEQGVELDQVAPVVDAFHRLVAAEELVLLGAHAVDHTLGDLVIVELAPEVALDLLGVGGEGELAGARSGRSR